MSVSSFRHLKLEKTQYDLNRQHDRQFDTLADCYETGQEQYHLNNISLEWKEESGNVLTVVGWPFAASFVAEVAPFADC